MDIKTEKEQLKRLLVVREEEKQALEDIKKYTSSKDDFLFTPLITRLKNLCKEHTEIMKSIDFIEPHQKEYLMRKYKITKRHNEHCNISLEKLFNATNNAMLKEELISARTKYLAEIEEWDILFDRRVKLLRERYESSWYWGWDL